jgi:hypothetical protein
MQVDKQQIIEHLDACIEIESMKEDVRTATVLSNLKEEIVDGSFDYGKARD